MTRVMVVGRDAALWLTAAAVQRALGPSGVRVAAVELPTMLSPASVYPALPALEALHARIGIDEAAMLRATGGTYAFGRRISGPGSQPFFVGWGTNGTPIGGEAFFPFFARAVASGSAGELQDLSPAATAALRGRMLEPDEELDAFGRVDYGYHLPAQAYVGMLKRMAAGLGFAMRLAPLVEVERDGERIAAIRLPGGERLVADFYIDASGPGAVLAGDAVPAGERRRIVARAPALPDPPPYAELRTYADGWLSLHATRADTRIEAVCAADVPAEASVAAFAKAAAMPLADVSIEPLADPIARVPWRGNCVAVGAAAFPADPMHGVELQVAQLGIVHLLSLFPASGNAAAECAEYNRLLASSFARMADFQQAAYALAPWAGPFWDAARRSPSSPTLAHAIATFRARGEVPAQEDETFFPDAWQALFMGLGVTPESWSPTADRTSSEEVDAALQDMQRFIEAKVGAAPSHAAYLADVVGSPA